MEMGSSSSSSSSSHPSDLLNGLKFGHKIYFEDVSIGVPGKSSSGCGSTSVAAVHGLPLPTTPKKGRTGMLQGGQPPRCQVEDCKADLSDAKAYYSRHKVCGMHSKSPKVIVAGLEQRFCQQCSRFHQLLEFDQGKRSCRRRLAGHNERRRKPLPGSLLSSSYGSLSSSVFESKSRTGSFMMDFAAYPSLNERDPWSSTRIPERVSTAMGKFLLNPWQSSLRGPSPNFFLQDSLDKTGYPGPAGIPPGECFTGTPDSSCALSLLSNPSWDSRNQPLSLEMNNPHSADGTHLAHSAGGNGTTIDQYPSTFWAFKGSEASSSSPEMIHPDLGLSQLSQPTNSHYPVGELELAHQSGKQYMELEHPRAYDSSIQHLHWSL